MFFEEIIEENRLPLTKPIIREIKSITKVQAKENSFYNNSLSIIEQFFIAPFVFTTENPVFYIPFSDEEILNGILETIGFHFNTLRIIDDGFNKTLTLHGLKTDTKEVFQQMLRQSEIEDIILEIYKKNKIPLVHNTKEFKINTKEIKKLDGHEGKEIWDFINATFIRSEGSFTLLTPGWNFDEDIKTLKIIRSLAEVYTNMQVTVDTDSNQIICLSVV